MERRKPGRPSKGPRVYLKGRAPAELHAAAIAAAEQNRMTLTDYLCELVSRDTGVPYTPQEALDFTDGGEALKTA